MGKNAGGQERLMNRQGKRAMQLVEGQHYWLEFTDIFKDFGGVRVGVSAQGIELKG